MSLKKNSLKRQAGFTLLELMVVIVILGVLASMVVPNLMGNKYSESDQRYCGAGKAPRGPPNPLL